MNTFEEQKAYFDTNWPDLREAFAAGGVERLAESIREHEDPLERRILFMFGRQGLAAEIGGQEGFDALIAFAEAGIAEFLAQAEAVDSPAERDPRIDGANVISFNLAADLADCWPGDETPRERRHFERGLAAAKDCLRWREELDKPAGPRNMAWWAKGMHEISLGRHADAVASMERALEFGKQAALAAGESPEIDLEGGFLPVLSAGYLGLARRRAGNAEGGAQYEAALAAFRAQLENPDRKDDASFGLEQLEAVAARYPG